MTLSYSMVSEECYPWMGKVDTCKVRKMRRLADARCPASANPRRDLLYKVGPAYLIDGEADIMQEIMVSGPVQGTIDYLCLGLPFNTKN